ncbi:hypothetical protein SS50377_22338 [Spironucleus salmonicida]|uniref:Uncharacterized protein n=1 Tax=Spironucleus salmonicida TaxID=348837 RepID=V6LCJ5_9EUKA|nr:hypothetical protein SS50377_22338 [Spironucleus salmonicida]|eukprot:EST42167.1 Hypothetical protein SS50377_18475 [Spironucleus salmonicida]
MTVKIQSIKPQFLITKPYPIKSEKYPALSNRYNTRAAKATIESPIELQTRRIIENVNPTSRSPSNYTKIRAIQYLSQAIDQSMLGKTYNTNATRQTVNYNPKIEQIEDNIKNLENQLDFVSIHREKICSNLSRTYSPLKQSQPLRQIKDLTQVKILVWNYEKHFQ